MELLENSLVQQIIGDTVPENEGFVVDNDVKAEWALKKIAEERMESQRYINVCREMISDYEDKIRKAMKTLDRKTSYLVLQLNEYFRKVEHRRTKTQETYRLPGGILKLRMQNPEFELDEEKLISFLKNNDMDNYIEIKEIVKWGELKKAVYISGGRIVTEDGQVIEGVTVKERDPVFEIDV